VTDAYYDYKGLLEFAWSHSVISDQLYKHVKSVCTFRTIFLTGECAHAMSLVYTQYDKIDIYNVYAPKCNTDESALSSSSKNTVEKTAKVIAHSVTSAGTVEIFFLK
jgi:serine carboxypeptidase-like clade 2